jgi:hypothetical protein
MKTMKRAFFITIAIIGLSAFSANAQSKATPTLAKGTPSARQNQPVTGAHKPEMAAQSTTKNKKAEPATTNNVPQMVPYSKSKPAVGPK